VDNRADPAALERRVEEVWAALADRAVPPATPGVSA
jgi:hypothetical protein